MRKSTTISLTVLFCLTSSVVLSETMDDLVITSGLYYKKFTDVPFTGKITGKEQGELRNGVKQGLWSSYNKKAQLLDKGSYSNGVEEGFWSYYYDNGQVAAKGKYKNGHWEGTWISFHPTGMLSKEETGTYKDGKKVAD